MVRRRQLMTVAVIMGLLAPALHAAERKQVSCTAIRKAVWANRTLEQIVAEYGTDAQHVMKCVQKQGRRRKDPKAPKKPAAHTAKPRKESARSSNTSKRDEPPQTRKSSTARAAH